MPFQSLQQMKWMYANKPEMAKERATETPNIQSLPKKKKATKIRIKKKK